MVEPIELGGLDQRVHHAMAAGVGTGEKIVLAADRDTAQGRRCEIVVEGQAAIVEAAFEHGGRAAPLGGVPGGAAYSLNRDYLYVANYIDKDLQVFDIADGNLTEVGSRPLKLPASRHPCARQPGSACAIVSRPSANRETPSRWAAAGHGVDRPRDRRSRQAG